MSFPPRIKHALTKVGVRGKLQRESRKSIVIPAKLVLAKAGNGNPGSTNI